MNKEQHASSVAVVGMACWYPGAQSLKEFWENILSRRVQFRKILNQRMPLSQYYHPDRNEPDKTYGSRAAYVDGFSFDWSAHRIPLSTFKAMDIAHWLALDVALKAVADARYGKQSMPREKTGVIVGNTLTGEQSRAGTMRLRWPYVKKALEKACLSQGWSSEEFDILARSYEDSYKSVFPPVNEDTLAGGLSNTIAGRICNYLDLRGGGYTVDGACSSSLLAVATALNGLASGDLDLALAGGVDISLDPFELIGFAKTNALTMKDMTVYDRRGSGFIPGEGCGFVMLKRLEDAKRDKDYIYATIHGWGISSDGGGTGLTAPLAEGQARAIRRAYERSSYDMDDLDFIEGHGTGTTVGDKVELTAISQAMDLASAQEGRSCGVTSLKSIIGHTKAASGIGAFIKTVLAVNRRVTPPTAGCKEPNPVFIDKALSLYPVLNGEVFPHQSVLRAGVSSMGFGGINCHITLSSEDPPHPELEPDMKEDVLLASSQDTEIFLFSGDTKEDVADQVAEVISYSEVISQAEMTDLSYQLSRVIDRAASIKGAVVAGNPDELTDGLRDLLKLLETDFSAQKTVSNPSHTAWVGCAAPPLRVGFLFPGQGSQKMNMGQTLIKRFPWAKDKMETADILLRQLGANPISEIIYKTLEKAVGPGMAEGWFRTLSDTKNAQPAICSVSAVWMDYLKKLGIEPVCVGGHSLGELTAFYASGAFGFQELVQLSSVRGDAMAASDDQPGAMASMRCDRATVEELLAGISEYVVLANINGPEQMVVSGTKAGIDEVARKAEARQINVIKLNVSNAFHSKMARNASETLKKTDIIPVHLPTVNTALFSSRDGRKIMPDLDLKKHFAEQVTSRVDFPSMIQAMSEECDLFIEVGPGRVLTGLVNAINQEHGPLCLPVESLPGKDRDLNQLLAVLFVNKVDVNWDSLFANRLVRPFTPPNEKTFIENPCERNIKVEVSQNIMTRSESSGLVDKYLMQKGSFKGDSLRSYLEARGGFLAEVIRADMTYGFPGSDEETFAKSPVEEPAISEPEENIQTATGDSFDITDLLTREIAEMTGYAPESLKGEMRLLDDLNLDSIKAGDLMVRLTKKTGIRDGILEAAKYANASLEEIAKAVEAVINSQDQVPGEPSDVFNPVNLGQTWVRDFSTGFMEEKMPGGWEDYDWSSANILILCKKSQAELAEIIKAKFIENKAHVAVETYGKSLEKKLSGSLDFTHYISLITSATDDLSDLEKLEQTIETLSSVIRLPISIEKQPMVTYVQFGGGFFGRTGGAVDFHACCAAAFARSIYLERDLRVRVLDFHQLTAPQELSDKVLREMSTPEAFADVGYDEKLTRRVFYQRAIEPGTYKPRDIKWEQKDVMLVTGGGKGITASCAFDLAQKTRTKVALVGRTPIQIDKLSKSTSGNDITELLQRYEKKGLEARYYSCDVSDRSAVKHLVETVEKEMGPVRAVIHGAGLNEPRLCHEVTPEDAVKEVSPKVMGALNILEALEGKPLKLFAAMNSIIGVTGMEGNAWYGFSNEVLDLILRRFKAMNTGTNIISVAFSIWGEEGMGARMGSVSALKQKGIDAIPSEEGIRRFTRLCLNNPGEDLIVVAARLGGLATLNLPELPAPENTRYLENRIYTIPGVESVFQCRLNMEEDPYFIDHNFKGSLILPTVFGLEAMAQVAAFTLGVKTLGPAIRIEDIRLERPVTLDPEEGTDIMLRALVLENSDAAEKGTISVKTWLAMSTEDLNKGHFSATFIFGQKTEPAQRAIERPVNPLPIVPAEDLYRPTLMFQGPRFQRIERIWEVNTTGDEAERAIFETHIKENRENSTAAFGNDQNMMLPDPFFHDSLLQSAQMLLPKTTSLPIYIKRWEMYSGSGPEPESILAEVVLNQRKEDKFHTTVTAVDQKGQVREFLEEYTLKIMQFHDEDNPSAWDLVQPDKRDMQMIDTALKQTGKAMNFKMPTVAIKYIPGIHELDKQERHKRQVPLILEAAQKRLKGSNDNVKASNGVHVNLKELEVTWAGDGRPAIHSEDFGSLSVSLSHTDRLCLCCVGTETQGCDIAPITHRGRTHWKSLLGEPYLELLEQLEKRPDSTDSAGTRLWALKEVLVKLGEGDFKTPVIEVIDGKAILFKADSAGEPVHIITIPLLLTWGLQTMMAVRVNPETNKMSGKIGVGDYEELEHHLKLLSGPQGQLCFAKQIPVTFRPNAQLSRTVYFPYYMFWAGEVREVSIWPILRKVGEQFSSGKWGSVANHSRLRLFGEATAQDRIEIRLWTDANYGPADSTMDLKYDFLKVLPNGQFERLAFCDQTVTWVEVIEHGIVKPAPYPEYYSKFMKDRLPQNESPKTQPEYPEPLGALHVVGPDEEYLYKSKTGPFGKPFLDELTINTSLDQADLVGNIYFANYYLWQGAVRDGFFYRLIPDYYQGTGERGELICLETQVHHLREAMPFDKILVTMALKDLTKCRASLYFEYFRIAKDGSKVKLAYGEQDCLWIVRNQSGKPAPVRFPLPVMEAFEKAIGSLRK